MQGRFQLETLSNHGWTSQIRFNGNLDVFEVAQNATDGRVILRGSSGVALASALHYYMKHDAHLQMSW